MPLLEQSFAVVIGRLRVVSQAFGRVAIHAGFTCENPHIARGGSSEEGIHAFGVDRAIAGNAGGAIGQEKIEIDPGYFITIGAIAKAHFFWESIGLEPIDQPFAPRGDDARLRVMGMGVDEARNNQALAVVGDGGVWMGAAQGLGGSDLLDDALRDQNGAAVFMVQRIGPVMDRGICELQILSENQFFCGHFLRRLFSCAPPNVIPAARG